MTKAAMPIRPVRTEADHRAAVARIEQLMTTKRTPADGDELDILSTLVDAYETKLYPMDVPDPLAMIRFCMDQQQLTRRDLEPMIGSRARVSEVLTGKRSLTLTMVRRLHERLAIPADILIQPTTSSKPNARADSGGLSRAPRYRRATTTEKRSQLTKNSLPGKTAAAALLK